MKDWARIDLTAAGLRQPLDKQRGFLTALLENVEDGIVACDSEGVLTVFNHAAREFHGLPEEPIPPDMWAERYDLYLPDSRTLMRKEEIPLFRALRGEEVRVVEMVVAPKGRPARTVLVSGRAIYGDAGEKLSAVVESGGEGRGSTFTVSLPLKPVAWQQEGLVGAAPQSPTPSLWRARGCCSSRTTRRRAPSCGTSSGGRGRESWQSLRRPRHGRRSKRRRTTFWSLTSGCREKTATPW